MRGAEGDLRKVSPSTRVRKEDLLQKYFMSQGDVPKAHSE